MPSPIRFTCSVLGSAWERHIWGQSSGPATRAFVDALKSHGVRVPEWTVIKLTWVVPSGKHKGKAQERLALWANGTVSPYVLRKNDSALQQKPLPEPSGAYLWE